jgi:predicted DNA-binding protein (UPF0251 family)
VPRPRKRRKLGRVPQAAIYKPAGIPLNNLRQIPIEPDELEALRLADLKGLTQEQGAQKMGISRSTFQRTLANARHQVALALVEGAAIKFVGSATNQSAGFGRKRDA